MENKFTKSKIITIILAVVIIILGILFYNFKSNTKNEYTETPVVDSLDNTTNPVDQKSSGGIIKNDTNLANTENDKNFNTAMTNAQASLSKSNYGMAIDYYNQALKYKNSDLPYSGMFNVYSAQQNWVKAGEVLDKAISLNSLNTDYWKWKLTLMDDKTNASFTELKKVYDEGFGKCTPKTRINLVVHFAQIAQNNNQKDEVIKAYKLAIDLNPTMKEIYQAEIDRLNK